MEAADIGQKCTPTANIANQVKMAHGLLRKIKAIIHEVLIDYSIFEMIKPLIYFDRKLSKEDKVSSSLIRT